MLAFADERLGGVVGTPNETEGVDASIRLQGQGAWRWEVAGYTKLRRFSSQFVRIDDDRTTVVPVLDQFKVPAEGFGLRFELRPPLPARQRLSLGADAHWTSGETREFFRNLGSGFTRERQAGGNSRQFGLGADYSRRFGDRLTLSLGGRMDYWQLTAGVRREWELATGSPQLAIAFPDRKGTEFGGRAGVTWQPVPAWRLQALGYRSHRVPTLNELYRPFRVGNDITEANAALRPERLSGGEMSLAFQPWASVDLRVTGYQLWLDEAIGNVTRGQGPGVFPVAGFVPAGGSLRQRDNLALVRSQGVEARAVLRSGYWEGSAAIALTHARVRDASAELDDRRPAQVPATSAYAGLTYSDPDGWGARAELTHWGAAFDDDLEMRRLPAATRLNGAIWLLLARHWDVRLSGENLLDADIVTALDGAGRATLDAGRQLRIALRYNY